MKLRGSEGEDDSASAREHKFNTIHKDSGMSTSQIDDYDDEDRQDDCWKKSINLGQRLVFKPEGAGYILWTTIIFFCEEQFSSVRWKRCGSGASVSTIRDSDLGSTEGMLGCVC